MPVVKIMPSGTSISSGYVPADIRDNQDKRGDITGWSDSAARRMIHWLWSINPDMLPDGGWAVTLTMGGTPDTSAEWLRARKSLVRFLQAHGVTLGQWLTEWTAKGRPHLHMCVFGSASTPPHLDRLLGLKWLEICDSEGWPAVWGAQHIVKVHEMTGWLKYVGKHASRGVQHYQRLGAPVGWEKTGRLWGHWGDWPVIEPILQELTHPEFLRYRAGFVDWQAKRMAAEGVPSEIVESYVAGKTPLTGAPVRGVSGWMPDDVALDLLTEIHTGDSPLGVYEWEN